MQDNLTPTLNEQQIRENISALQKQNVSNDKIQAYVNNYQSDGKGGYSLKTQNQPQTTQTNSNRGADGRITPLNPIETAKGIVKGGLRTTIGTAQSLQSAGKFVLGKVGIDTSQMGFPSLDTTKPQGQAVNQMIQPSNPSQEVGGNLETLGELGSGFVGDIGKIKTGATKVVQMGQEALQTAKVTRATKATEEATAKVSEMLSPKATLKEARQAQSEGRLIKGKPATFFKSGTPDIVHPSSKVQSATQTVIKNIPNADKMSPSELYNAVEDHLGKTAQALRPSMEATPIKPETIQKINSDWKALKESQIKVAPATEEANVAKRQANFESFLQKSGAETHADLWDTRINYDKSISANVKKATSLSPESLQLQKTEWLQNRNILNQAIHDTSQGMSKESQKAFNDMSNLYEAKTNLLGKAKIEAKIKPSGLSKAYNSKTGRLIRTGAKIGIGGEIIAHELGL